MVKALASVPPSSHAVVGRLGLPGDWHRRLGWVQRRRSARLARPRRAR